MSADSQSTGMQAEEIAAIIAEVKQRVRARYPGASVAVNGGATPPVSVPLANLMPIVYARDAAQAKMAAIGSVNPRRGGPVNSAIQAIKKTISRSLGWFVRDQITFNRETMACVEAILESLNEVNRSLLALGSDVSARLNDTSQQFAAQYDPLRESVEELKDIRSHWAEWRRDWERKLATNEMQFLRSVADLQSAFQLRATLMESGYRDTVKSQHADFLGALERANFEIQKRLWADLERIRLEYERLIHNELRIVRQRITMAPATGVPAPLSAPSRETSLPFDYARFAERFRGSEEYVRGNQEFYKPFFTGRTGVLDIGCGRGEFLDLMREMEVPARGIDLSAVSVAHCRGKGLEAEVADLYEYLGSLPDLSLGGIYSGQVVEHLPPERLPEMIKLCAAKLDRGGILAIDTPNPECLAIFSTHFFLDPTHTRPVPHPLLAFYMEEFGLGAIEVHKLAPAVESMPEIAELPENFRNKFFGGLDYAILGVKL